jgi:prolyl-tRNA synthetase
MFADMDLIGIPHRIVIGERGLASEQFEYKGRSDDNPSVVAIPDIVDFLRQRLGLSG